MDLSAGRDWCLPDFMKCFSFEIKSKKGVGGWVSGGRVQEGRKGRK